MEKSLSFTSLEKKNFSASVEKENHLLDLIF